MLKLTKTGIGLLTRQYRSVLKKCWAINVGLFAIMFSNIQHADASIKLRLANDRQVYLVNNSDAGTYDFLTTSDLSSYVTSSSLSSTLSNYVTSSSLSSTLSNYATQTWVNNKGYLTSSSLSGYATQTYVDEAVASAGGGSNYTAGDGISIENDTISLDTEYLDNNYYTLVINDGKFAYVFNYFLEYSL